VDQPAERQPEGHVEQREDNPLQQAQLEVADSQLGPDVRHQEGDDLAVEQGERIERGEHAHRPPGAAGRRIAGGRGGGRGRGGGGLGLHAHGSPRNKLLAPSPPTSRPGGVARFWAFAGLALIVTIWGGNSTDSFGGGGAAGRSPLLYLPAVP